MAHGEEGFAARITDVQRRYNAFAWTDGAPVPRHGDGPLSNVTVSVKDIIDIAGLPTRWGSRLLADASPAARDAIAVSRLRAAGATIAAKTTTTEFAHSPLGYAPLTGMTINPWNPARTCGGSSSGAGVAVATGATPVSLTTDAGCSTRLPAALTGTFGLKPTLGRMPHDQLPEGFANIVHLGLIADSIDLLERALAAASGAHDDDPFSQARPAYSRDDSDAGWSGRHVLLWLRAGNEQIDDEVRAQMNDAANHARALGATVTTADYPLDNPDPCWAAIQRANWAGRFASLDASKRPLLSPSMLAGIDAGLALSAADLNQALVKRTAFFRAIQKAFGDYDFILTPCLAAPAVAADHPVNAILEVSGRPAGTLRRAWFPYLSLFDLSGHPALALPCGIDRHGVPMGIQLVAPWWKENRLLAAGRAWESSKPRPTLPDIALPFPSRQGIFD